VIVLMGELLKGFALRLKIEYSYSQVYSPRADMYAPIKKSALRVFHEHNQNRFHRRGEHVLWAGDVQGYFLQL
jgi:hypothetical protein